MRENNITYIRVAVTILVVLFHALGYYTFDWPWGSTKIYECTLFDRVLNQFNMSIFVAISGYLFALHSQKVLGDTISYGITNKLFRLLIPYLFWSGCQIIVFRASLNYLSILYGCLHLWFLLMLFNIFIFAYLSRRFLLLSEPHWLIVTMIVLSLWAIIPNTPTILSINQICKYAIFFVLGIYVERFPYTFRQYAIIPIMLLSVIVVAVFTAYTRAGIFGSWLRVASCSTFIFALLQSTRNHIYSIPQWIIHSLDKNSMGIYIIHHMIIWALVQQHCIQNLLDTHLMLGPMLLFIIGLMGAWSISALILTNKYTSFLLGAKKL